MKKDDEQSNRDILQFENNFFQSKTKFELLEERFKKTIFGVLNILLKFSEGSFLGEVLSLINETCQFLYYPFYSPMGYIWKKDSLFSLVSKCLSYFQTVVFFNNVQLYIVVFYVMMLMVILVVVDIVYVSISMASKNKAAAIWPMRLLRSVVSFIVTVMFMPLVEFFVAIMECSNTDSDGQLLGYYQNYNIDGLHCWENTHYTVMFTLAILIVVVFVIICAVVQTIFYETKTSDKVEGVKTNSKADLMSLFVKIVLIINYSFLVYNKTLHWFVVPATFLVGFMQFYVYWEERPFYEEKMNTAFFIHTGIFLWSTIVLLLCKFLVSSNFDGGIFIFFIGTPVIVIIILTQRDNRFKLLLTNINKFEKGNSVVKQIRYFLELTDTKYQNRKSKILLKGYIYVHEKYCILNDCPLKKYLKESERGEKGSVKIIGTQTGYGIDSVNNIQTSGPVLPSTNAPGSTTLLTGNCTSFGNHKTEADIYLFQYAMLMYQNAISKFPNCTALRMSYSFFLIERMNNSKKSLIELKNCEKYEPTFEEEFIIFRFTQGGGGVEEANENEDEEGLDIVSNIAYKNHYNLFKEGLTNITSIYNEFWTLLLNHSQQCDEDLARMNELGEKINKLIEEIKMNYDEMEKLKYNDEEILTLYSNFFQDILNDKTQAEYYKNRLHDLQGNSSIQNGEKKEEYDGIVLPQGDEFEYIFLSAEDSKLGTIMKASIGIFTLFGYSPKDLIGKNIDLIMPDLYQEQHKLVLINRTNKFKTQMNQNFRNNILKGQQKVVYKEIFNFGKNKLKNIIPLSMKVTLISSQEQNEIFFAARITNEDLYNDINAKNPSTGIPPIINFNMKVCFVLTDLNFIIQFHTPNAANLLGFKTYTVGNADITKSISDLNNAEDKNEVNKIPKNEMFKKRYIDQKKIIWKTLLNEEDETVNYLDSSAEKINMKSMMNYSKSLHTKTPTIQNSISIDNNNYKKAFIPLKRQKYKEDIFLLNLTETIMIGQAVGYVFRFEVADKEDDINGYDDSNFLPNDFIDKKPTENSKNELSPGYIPEINKIFELDTRKMAFYSHKESKEGNNNINWKNKIQDFALNKFKKYQQKLIASKTTESNEEDEEEEDEDGDDDDDYDSNDYDGSSYDSNENSSFALNQQDKSNSLINNNNSNTQGLLEANPNDDNNTTTTIKKILPDINNNEVNKVKRASIKTRSGRRQTIVGDGSENNYYHVKIMSSIKFSIYDYKKKRLVDVPPIKRESQVEYKKKEELPDLMPGKRNEKERKKTKGVVNKRNEKEEEEEESENVDAIVVKQIEYALRKEEFQPEIIKLRWVSFLTYSLIIIISSLLLVLLLSNIQSVNENISMVSNLHQLISNIINGIYYMRELVLLNNSKYTKSLFSRNISITNATVSLSDLFSHSYLLQQKILTTSIIMTKGRENLFINGTTTVKSIEVNQGILSVRTINLTINNAITQAYTSMYQIANTPIDGIYATNSDIYYYINNAFDPIMSCLIQNMNNFMNELRDNVSSFKTKHLIILGIVLIGLFISSIAIRIFYSKIIQLKSSYLEVFFEIKDNVSKKALDKCEQFAQMLHPLVDTENESNEDDEEIPQSQNNTQENDEANSSNSKPKKKKSNIYTDLIFIFEIFVVFSIIIAYFLSVVFIFQNSLDIIIDYENQYNISAFQKHDYLITFDKLREYFFEPNFQIGSISISEEVERMFSHIYNTNNSVNAKLTPEKFPIAYIDIYKRIHNSNLCNYTGDLFISSNAITNNKLTCETLTSNSSNYGIDVLLSHFIEKLRSKKYDFDSMLKEANSKYPNQYNNTLYNFNDDASGSSTSRVGDDYDKLNPFNIFNDDDVFTLNIIRKYFIDPVFIVMIDQLYQAIITYWENNNNLYIALMIVLLISITGLYIFIWRPFESKLDQDIYKTKNMLSIIPKDVLASLKSINNLLNLGSSVSYKRIDNKGNSNHNNHIK